MIGWRGLDILRSFEKCRLVSYDDGGGTWTIGWGHTAGVKEGQTCTKEQADVWLAKDCEEAEAAVVRYVTAPMNGAMRDAAIVFAYNLGSEQFAGSEFLEQLNRRRYEFACRALFNWISDGNKPSRGLLRRRLAEGTLFASEPWPVMET